MATLAGASVVAAASTPVVPEGRYSGPISKAGQMSFTIRGTHLSKLRITKVPDPCGFGLPPTDMTMVSGALTVRRHQRRDFIVNNPKGEILDNKGATTAAGTRGNTVFDFLSSAIDKHATAHGVLQITALCFPRGGEARRGHDLNLRWHVRRHA